MYKYFLLYHSQVWKQIFLPEVGERGMHRKRESKREKIWMSICPKDRLSGWARKWERENGWLSESDRNSRRVGGGGREVGSHMVLSAIPFREHMSLLEVKAGTWSGPWVDLNFHIFPLPWPTCGCECESNKECCETLPPVQTIYFIWCLTETQWSEGKTVCVWVTGRNDEIRDMPLPKELAKAVLNICNFYLLRQRVLTPQHCLLGFMGNCR